jgi:hypothetical protein
MIWGGTAGDFSIGLLACPDKVDGKTYLIMLEEGNKTMRRLMALQNRISAPGFK